MNFRALVLNQPKVIRSSEIVGGDPPGGIRATSSVPW
jgi:hypothetical protein